MLGEKGHKRQGKVFVCILWLRFASYALNSHGCAWDGVENILTCDQGLLQGFPSNVLHFFSKCSIYGSVELKSF